MVDINNIQVITTKINACSEQDGNVILNQINSRPVNLKSKEKCT